MNQWAIFGVIVAIAIFLASIFYAGISSLDKKIGQAVDDKINSPDFINKVAEKAKRPIVMFDQHGSVLLDGGGMVFINDIRVKLDRNDPVEITISPNKHLNVAPILESLDAEYVIRERRGNKFDWVYELGAVQALVLESSAKAKEKLRFRLEIIP
jgi:hypothetical protein